MNIDLNADLGEGGDADEALLGLVSSANIACGWHAGGANAMRDCVRLAVQRGVAIGESFLDRDEPRLARHRDEPAIGKPEHRYGWIEVVHGRDDCLGNRGIACRLVIQGSVRLQMRHAHAFHLRNRRKRTELIKRAGVDVVRRQMHFLAPEVGRIMKARVSADRGYRSDGSLVPRNEPGALIDDDDEMLAHVLSMVRDKRVRAVTGDWVPLDVRTLCLHGDGAHALAFAQKLRRALEENGVDVQAASGLGH
jgi:UPF0271 protein